MTSTIGWSLLRRGGREVAGTAVQPREFVDFVVAGRSLLETLTSGGGGHADYMSRIVTGFVDPAREFVQELLGVAPSPSSTGRVLFYVCPECGDIGCGAYAVRVTQVEDNYKWFDFAYENGYEEPRPLPHVGPFTFDSKAYQMACDDVLQAITR
jgi:hypothetical protein